MAEAYASAELKWIKAIPKDPTISVPGSSIAAVA
jgi:hypothetical protein